MGNRSEHSDLQAYGHATPQHLVIRTSFTHVFAPHTHTHKTPRIEPTFMRILQPWLVGSIDMLRRVVLRSRSLECMRLCNMSNVVVNALQYAFFAVEAPHRRRSADIEKLR